LSARNEGAVTVTISAYNDSSKPVILRKIARISRDSLDFIELMCKANFGDGDWLIQFGYRFSHSKYRAFRSQCHVE